jgi:peptide/nickel transport system substrate-binding protein
VYGGYSPEQLLALPEANERPVGWGPFMVGPEGWVKGDHLTLVRNPAYFRAAEGLPEVDQVTFRFGLGAAAIVDELAAGRCHVTGSGVDPSGQLAALAEAGDLGQLTPQFVPEGTFEHLDFGLLPAEDYKRPAGNDLFEDARVRQAVAFCLDREALIDELLNGLSEVPAVYVPAGHPYFAGESLAEYPFDAARGRALLDEAGWVDADGDGVREQARRRLTLELASGPPESAFRQALTERISAQVGANCGIEVKPVLYPTEALYDLWPNGVLFGRRFDLGSFPWRTGAAPPCDLYLSSAIASDQNPAGTNNVGYSNPAFDQACLSAQRAFDEATRAEQHRAAQVIFSQDLPSLPLFFRPMAGASAPGVSGYVLDPTAADLWKIEEIAVP